MGNNETFLFVYMVEWLKQEIHQWTPVIGYVMVLQMHSEDLNLYSSRFQNYACNLSQIFPVLEIKTQQHM